MADFLLWALLAGLGVALVAGPLGSFVVWRRMAYFGDTLAHSALLGVALGLLAEFDLTLAIALVAAAIAGGLLLLERAGLASDTALGILSHSALAVGLIVVSLAGSLRVDLNAYLFGDLLAVTPREVGTIWGVGALLVLLLAWQWRPLLSMAVDEELARVEGHPILRLKGLLMLLLALLVAVAIKVVGVLLITALILIPAAAAGRLARSPEQMAWLASACGALAVAMGLAASWRWDLPAGPAVVASASALFLLSLAARRH